MPYENDNWCNVKGRVIVIMKHIGQSAFLIVSANAPNNSSATQKYLNLRVVLSDLTRGQPLQVTDVRSKYLISLLV